MAIKEIDDDILKSESIAKKYKEKYNVENIEDLTEEARIELNKELLRVPVEYRYNKKIRGKVAAMLNK